MPNRLNQDASRVYSCWVGIFLASLAILFALGWEARAASHFEPSAGVTSAVRLVN